MALWTDQAHACPAFIHTPRLNLSSPEPGCGKTTTLDLMATMAPRPLRTENLTAPVLFRLVDQHQPTLLLDEVDSYLTQTDELRGLLNAGHKRGACAYRCEGQSNAVRAFKAFAPAVLPASAPCPAPSGTAPLSSCSFAPRPMSCKPDSTASTPRSSPFSAANWPVGRRTTS